MSSYPMSDNAPVRSKLGSLQLLRAVAAIMVVLFHLNGHVYPMQFNDGEGLWTGFEMGYAGVEIFFVLSGFIMVHVHRSDFGLRERVGTFLRKRIIRIYPLYWFVLLMAVGLVLSREGAVDGRDLVIAAALLPDFDAYPITQAWTLAHEMLFYLLFALVIYSPRWGLALSALWFGACLAVAVTGYDGFGASFLVGPINLFFALGIAAALLLPRVGAGFGWALACGGAVALFGAGLAYVYDLVVFATFTLLGLYGLGAGGLVLGLAAADRTTNVSWPRPAIFLGDASYAIYLVHGLAFVVAARAIREAGLDALLPSPVIFVFLFFAAIAAGSLVHLVVEKPLLKALRKPDFIFYRIVARASNKESA